MKDYFWLNFWLCMFIIVAVIVFMWAELTLRISLNLLK
jgi:hypothetical protein